MPQPDVTPTGGRPCEECGKPAEFWLYSAYDAPSTAVHPLVHRYPGAMYGACSDHVAKFLNADRIGTPQWVVSREPLPMFPGGH